jgi:hypothetical protein
MCDHSQLYRLAAIAVNAQCGVRLPARLAPPAMLAPGQNAAQVRPQNHM